MLLGKFTTFFMQMMFQASEKNMVVDYKDWQIPLGRRFRCVATPCQDIMIL